jgi:hypothetical protein
MLRWAKRALIAIVALYALYLIAIHVVLFTPLLEKAIASAQDNVRITYDRAFSFIPGRVHVKNLRIVSQDTSIELEIDIEDTVASLWIPDLRKKKVTVQNGDARGVRFLLRKTRPLAELCDAKPYHLPPIGPLSSPPAFMDKKTCLQQVDTHMIRTGPPDPSKLWTVELDDVIAKDIHEVWLEDYRFLGQASSDSTLVFFPTTFLFLGDVKLDIQRGGLVIGQEALATDLHGSARFDMPQVSLEKDEVKAVLGAINLEAKLKAQLQSFAFLDRYLDGIGYLSFNEGKGSIDAELAATQGKLKPGSKLVLEGDRIAARLYEHHATGSGKVTYELTENAAKLDFRLHKFRVRRSWDKKSQIVGKNLHLALYGKKSATLEQPLKDPGLSITVEDAYVPDVSAYNGYIPSTSGFKLLSGDLRMKLTKDDLTIRTGTIRAQFRQLELEARADVDAPITSSNHAKRSYEVKEAKIGVRQGRVVETGTTERATDTTNWWADFTVPKATIDLDEAKYDKPQTPTAAGSARVKLANVRPLLAVFDAIDKVPSIARRIDPGQLDGTFDFAVSKDGYAFDQVIMKSGAIEVQANIYEKKGKRAGGLLLGLSGLRIGIEIEGDKTSLSLVNPTGDYYANKEARKGLRITDETAQAAADERQQARK